MKTIREWFEELPEGDNAIRNSLSNDLESMESRMSDALINGFSWPRSTEGAEYWLKIYKRELRKERHDSPSFSSPSPHRLFEQIAEYVDKHDLKTYKILVTNGTAEIIETGL